MNNFEENDDSLLFYDNFSKPIGIMKSNFYDPKI
jgi:hypothetical protein